MAGKILIVEDEMKIARTVRLYLEQSGFQVTTVHDGALAMPAFRHERPDLVILDLLLPHMDGWEICRQIRRESDVPIIMLTARDQETDRIVGLELGADDYITKPFSPREVVARVRAILRRVRGALQPLLIIRAGDVVVDLERREASVAGRPLELTPTEFDLLAVLASHPGQVFTRLQLLDQLQGSAYAGYERVIDQHIKNLRAKLGDDAHNPRYIATVYGVGYKFLLEEAAHA
ncbi:MAG: response regulator transcription factor [Anaerolineae bacterium]|nr:response regulator transcription factor [Anaerolineae bacterium]MDW8098820.1 response regulator transcription factor [Anaerolineae bacterium]